MATTRATSTGRPVSDLEMQKPGSCSHLWLAAPTFLNFPNTSHCPHLFHTHSLPQPRTPRPPSSPLAAMEGEAASLSMCVNYWRSDRHREPQVTESWVRGNTTARLSAYLDERGFGMPRSLLDVGASVGVSTQFLHEAFPRSEVTGLDLSPYFVAMATYRARENDLPIRYIHANAEHTGLPSGSVDVITVNYMLHEVPTEATKRILSELHRVLRPGGVILICDLDGDKVRDNFVVSSFRKWAFEVTEPHIYQYYQNDLLENLAGVGFDPSSLKKTSNDPINALWFAQKAVEMGSAPARPGMRVEGRVPEGRE